MPYGKKCLKPESNPIFPTSLEGMLLHPHCKDEEIALYSGEVTCQKSPPIPCS